MSLQEYHVEGMSCAACAGRLEKALLRNPANARAVVNFATATAAVETTLSTQDIQNLVDKIGFKAIPKNDDLSVQKSEEKHFRKVRLDLFTAFTLGIPVFIISMAGLIFPGSDWIQLVLTSAVLFGPGRGFFVRAIKLLRHWDSNMDTLVAVGTFSAFAYSIWLMFAQAHQGHLYFETACAIIGLILFGKFLEERAKQRASASIVALMSLQPDVANVQKSAGKDSEVSAPRYEQVPVRFVKPGQTVLVRTGERISVDGHVIDGESSVDESMMTGEAQPVRKALGDPVSAGTLNEVAPLWIQVGAVGESTVLSRIVALVAAAQGTKAPIQRIADKVSGRFVPLILVLAVLTCTTWVFLGADFEFALLASVSVLVVACPCALGLATPVALVAATGRAAESGILIKDAPSLELLHRADMVIFDKTGTLTQGTPEVTQYIFDADQAASFALTEGDILESVRVLEEHSTHPVAKALVRYLSTRKVQLGHSVTVEGIQEVPGHGMSSLLRSQRTHARTVDAADFADRPEVHELTVGNFTSKHAFTVPPEQLGTRVSVSVDGREVAVFTLEDKLRDDAFEAVAKLRSMGLETLLASGDREAEVQRIAEKFSPALRYVARQNPSDKAELVKRLKGERHKGCVLMVGDGINDAPALAVSDVGIALGSGTDVAMATAGVTLRTEAIGKIVEAISLSKATFRNIKQNLFWAFAYNVILIPVAMSGELTPMLAAAAMSFSSLFVVVNAMRLRRFSA